MTDHQRDNAELLPCPFCGDSEEVGARYQDKAWRVHCGSCGGCAYGWESEGQAIATWNTRSLSQQPPAETGDDGLADFVAEAMRHTAGTDRQQARQLIEAIASRLSVSTGEASSPQPDTDVVERVARALSVPEWHTSWDKLPDNVRDRFYMQADYAIAALNASTPEIQRLRAEVRLAMQALSAFGDTEEGVTTAYNILKDVAQ